MRYFRMPNIHQVVSVVHQFAAGATSPGPWPQGSTFAMRRLLKVLDAAWHLKGSGRTSKLSGWQCHTSGSSSLAIEEVFSGNLNGVQNKDDVSIITHSGIRGTDMFV